MYTEQRNVYNEATSEHHESSGNHRTRHQQKCNHCRPPSATSTVRPPAYAYQSYGRPTNVYHTSPTKTSMPTTPFRDVTNYVSSPTSNTIRTPRSTASQQVPKGSSNRNVYHRNTPNRAPAGDSQTTPPTPQRSNMSSIDRQLRMLFLQHNIDLSDSHKLGCGRYSKVITGRLLSSNMQIAVKVINTHRVTSDFRNKFLPREIDCWKQLSHPNLVGILGHYEAMNYVFLSMEFGPIGDLLSFVQKNGPIHEVNANQWLFQIISGVSYMHSKGIAHRDLKLENIILFSERLVKIGDFGFSKMVNQELSMTYCGSKSYSAPEILLGEPYSPYKADVWSVGVVAFVMVTDCMPFNEKQPNPAIVDSQRLRTYKYNPKLHLSEECRQSIDRMMTFSWTERPDINQCLCLPWMYRFSNSYRPMA